MQTSTHILRGLPGRWVLPVLLAIAAQSVQAEEWKTGTLMLNDKMDCREAISNVKGNTLNVQLGGRTLYRDGDWNTLCLPFGMTADQIANSPLAHASIQELDASYSSLDSDGQLTLTFTNATTVTAGKPFIVRWPVALTINNDSEWDTFADNVASGTTYEGQIVKLAADINIGTGDMVGSMGSTEQPFKGTFDGGGHTINCTIDDNSASNNYTAPFVYIQDATIMNVKVAGSVKGGNYSGGLVGMAAGTNTIKNCVVAATVSSYKTYCGGVLGRNLHQQGDDATIISDCLFSGTISSTEGTQVGIFCGSTEEGSTVTISNCLADGTYSGYGTVDMILGNGTKTVNNCYKTQKVGSTGTYTTPATDLAAALGTSNWTTSGKKAVPLMTATNHVENPTFSNMVIDATEHNCDNGAEGDLRVRFIGTYNYTSFNADDKSILLMGAGNKLYYPQSGASIGPCRAYFKIGEDGTTPARELTEFNLIFDDGDTSGITEAEANSSFFTLHSSFNDWYTLDGRRLEDKPSRAGVYIYKGKKRVIK